MLNTLPEVAALKKARDLVAANYAAAERVLKAFDELFAALPPYLHSVELVQETGIVIPMMFSSKPSPKFLPAGAMQRRGAGHRTGRPRLPRRRKEELQKKLVEAIQNGKRCKLSESENRDIDLIHTLVILRKMMRGEWNRLTSYDWEVIGRDRLLRGLSNRGQDENPSPSPKPKRRFKKNHEPMRDTFQSEWKAYNAAKAKGSNLLPVLTLVPAQTRKLMQTGQISSEERTAYNAARRAQMSSAK